MINVLVVEDEPPILKSICRNIEKANQNFSVIYRAYNGKEALDILEQNSSKIDVVITDIQMPVVNGLELLNTISVKYPTIFRLVLSGFEDFNYAKEGFKCGIFDYMLKPIDKPLFRSQLEKLEKAINSRREKHMYEILFQCVHSSKPITNIKDEFKHRQLKLILICAGPFPISDYDYLLPGRSYWDKIDLDRICSRFLGDAPHWIIPGKSSVEQIIICSSKGIPLDAEKKLYDHLNKLDTLPITLCESPTVLDLNSIHQVHHQQRKALHHNIIFKASKFIVYNPDISVKDTADSVQKLNLKLKQDINSNILSDIEEVVLTRSKNLLKNEITQIDLEDYLFFTTHIFNSHNTTFKSENFVKELVTNSYNTEELLSGLKEYLTDILEPKSSHAPQKENLVKEMKDFIILNFNKPISNQTLSDKFGLVPSYISNIFKCKMGVSPSEFILEYRMEKAKDLLQSSSNLFTKDVAQMVGYSDPLYFSRVFKKYYGVNPGKIKKAQDDNLDLSKLENADWV